MNAPMTLGRVVSFCIIVWFLLAGMLALLVGAFHTTTARPQRVLGGGAMALIVTLAAARIFVDGRSRDALARLKANLGGRLEPEPIVLRLVLDSIRFAASWTYLVVLALMGIAYGISQTGMTAAARTLPDIDAVSTFLHWGLSLASVVLFLDALLHICILVRGLESKEVIHALISGVAGVTILILLPLKEIPLALFREKNGGILEMSKIAEMSYALWLPVVLVIGLVASLGGLLLLRRRFD